MQMLLELPLESGETDQDCGHEAWQPIEWAPGYEVSSHGRFRRCVRGTLNEIVANNGYRRVGFIVGGTQLIRLAHRVVAGAFLPNPHRHPVVNYKNGDRLDNRVSNIEWASRSRSFKDAWAGKRGVA